MLRADARVILFDRLFVIIDKADAAEQYHDEQDDDQMPAVRNACRKADACRCQHRRADDRQSAHARRARLREM